MQYFGENPRSEDMFGVNPFPDTYEDLEKLATAYRNWYESTDDHSLDNVPKEFYLAYQIHLNLSNESLSRAKLLSVLTERSLEDCLEEVLAARSIPIPIESFNGATIYASTIYRGKTQVNTGTTFEQKIANFVNRIDNNIEMMPGRDHGGSKYDKDIYIDGQYRLSAEMSFQVTTNSVIERKSHLEIHPHLTIVMIFGGLGWIERINALERIVSEKSGYSDCFGPCDAEMERLRTFILAHRT